MSIFPFEIFEQIIDQAQDDQPFISAACMVARSWIYSRKYLKLRVHRDNLVALNRLVASPHSTLNAHVRSVHFSCSEASTVNWCFSRLTCLVLSHITFLDERAWILQSAFQCISVLELRDNLFECTHAALVLVSNFRSLKALVLGKMQVKHFPCSDLHVHAELHLPPIALNDVHVELQRGGEYDIWNELFAWLLTAPAPTISRLTLSDAEAEGLQSLNRLLKTLGPVLEHLSLQFFDSETYLSSIASGGKILLSVVLSIITRPDPELMQLVRLCRDLRSIRLPIQDEERNGWQTWFYELLCNTRCLETIIFVLPQPPAQGLTRGTLSQVRWQQLAVMFESTQFSRLRELHFSGHKLPVDLEGFVQSQFVKIMAHVVLRFDN